MVASSETTFRSKVCLALHSIENLVFLGLSVMELLSETFTTSVDPLRELLVSVVASCGLLGVPIITRCFLGIDAGSTSLVQPYLYYTLLSPIANVAYAVDKLHRVIPCGGNAVPSQSNMCEYMQELTIFIVTALALLAGFRYWSVVPLCALPEDLKRVACKTHHTLSRDKGYSEHKQPLKAYEPGLTGRRPLQHLPRGCEVFEGTIKFFDERRGYGFITLNGQSRDVYFKKTTLTAPLQAMGTAMAGTQVRFIVRWMPDGTPQVRAAVPAGRNAGHEENADVHDSAQGSTPLLLPQSKCTNQHHAHATPEEAQPQFAALREERQGAIQVLYNLALRAEQFEVAAGKR